MSDIVFGTDGWRGRIADDYTFANVRRCSQGFAAYLQQTGDAASGVVIGHDKRFQAEDFAAAAAEVLEYRHRPGVIVLVTEPTPFGLYDLTLAQKAFASLKTPMGVVINRSDIGDERVEEYCNSEIGRRYETVWRLDRRLFGGGDHAARVGHRVGQRLFAEHVTAGLQGLDRDVEREGVQDVAVRIDARSAFGHGLSGIVGMG